jgi:poly(A) polymerase Pap1
MVADTVVNTVQRYLRALEESGLPVRFGVVFGSMALGTAGEHSDIDLLVVSTRFDAPRSREDVNLMWRAAARVDSRIEPIACGERQYVEDQGAPIFEVARRQGQRIDPLG